MKKNVDRDGRMGEGKSPKGGGASPDALFIGLARAKFGYGMVPAGEGLFQQQRKNDGMAPRVADEKRRQIEPDPQNVARSNPGTRRLEVDRSDGEGVQ